MQKISKEVASNNYGQNNLDHKEQFYSLLKPNVLFTKALKIRFLIKKDEGKYQKDEANNKLQYLGSYLRIADKMESRKEMVQSRLPRKKLEIRNIRRRKMGRPRD